MAGSDSAPKDEVYIGCMGGADRTFACKSQECSRGCHSSVTSLTSLCSRASHIIASDTTWPECHLNIMAGKTILNQGVNWKKNTVIAPWNASGRIGIFIIML